VSKERYAIVQITEEAMGADSGYSTLASAMVSAVNRLHAEGVVDVEVLYAGPGLDCALVARLRGRVK
jgi:hypothetical protein